MDPEQLDALRNAELTYAHYNAARTGTLDDSEPLLHLEHRLPHLIDSSRPTSVYYCRAVVPSDVAQLADCLDEIPQDVSAAELYLPQQTPDNFATLLRIGFVPAYTLCYLVAKPGHADVHGNVEQLGANQVDYFFDLLSMSGVEWTADKRSKKRPFYCNSELLCFVSYSNNREPAAWGTMFVSGDTAFLANAFTLPAHRGHGHHGALLATRLALAGELGVKRVFTDVEPMSKSHRNCERAGFQLLTPSLIWKRKH